MHVFEFNFLHEMWDETRGSFHYILIVLHYWTIQGPFYNCVWIFLEARLMPTDRFFYCMEKQLLFQ